LFFYGTTRSRFFLSITAFIRAPVFPPVLSPSARFGHKLNNGPAFQFVENSGSSLSFHHIFHKSKPYSPCIFLFFQPPKNSVGYGPFYFCWWTRPLLKFFPPPSHAHFQTNPKARVFNLPTPKIVLSSISPLLLFNTLLRKHQNRYSSRRFFFDYTVRAVLSCLSLRLSPAAPEGFQPAPKPPQPSIFLFFLGPPYRERCSPFFRYNFSFFLRNQEIVFPVCNPVHGFFLIHFFFFLFLLRRLEDP